MERNNSLSLWDTSQIIAGQNISQELNKQVGQSELFLFLISSHFLASDDCMILWNDVRTLAASNPRIIRIPIILSDCAWQDLLKDDDILPLPKDGRVVSSFSNPDNAWQQIYDGISAAVTKLKNTFSAKAQFLSLLDSTMFVSEGRQTLSNTFVFPSISNHQAKTSDQQNSEEFVASREVLLGYPRVIVHGEEMSGKTALARHLCLHLISKGEPVLLVDMTGVSRTVNKQRLRRFFSDQYSGDYQLWSKLPGKTVIFDNLSSASHMLELVELSKEIFERIIIFARTDVFLSYYQDEDRLSEFEQCSLGTLDYENQERLIRRWLTSSTQQGDLSDGAVDRAEDLVNSVIISNKIVPRYPFYVLSIMQTQEDFMPSNMDITSYGHCYYALIVANLVKAGISKSGGALESCFNFAEHLAYRLFTRSEGEEFTLETFTEEYLRDYMINEAAVNRMSGDEYGIISKDGSFRASFMYLFFLGRYLAQNLASNASTIEGMCRRIHEGVNDKILLFLIHHTNDEGVIEDILLRTMCTLDGVSAATLSTEESHRFFEIVRQIKIGLVKRNDVPEERSSQRRLKSQVQREVAQAESPSQDTAGEANEEESELRGRAMEMYRVLRSNQVLGQILRNKFGSLKRGRVEEIIEAIADSGLRMVNSLLGEEEIEEKSLLLSTKFPEATQDEVRQLLRMAAFVWTMANLELVVHCTNVPETREAMEGVVNGKGTPAYDVIGYFSLLDGSEELNSTIRQKLGELWKKHNNIFIRQILVFRTMNYMNTHRSEVREEQAVCSIMGVPYRQGVTAKRRRRGRRTGRQNF